MDFLTNSLGAPPCTDGATEPTASSPDRGKARVTFSPSPLRKNTTNNNKGSLLLPNIPVNREHRTLLDTLAELACAGTSSSDVPGPQHSPRRRARAMSEPWFVDDSYRYADAADAVSSSGVASLTHAAMMGGGYDEDLVDPESLSSACVLTSLAGSRSPLTSAYGSSSSSNYNSGSNSSGSSVSDSPGTSLFGIASWAARKLPEYAPRSLQATTSSASSQSLPLPQLLEDGVDYSSIYNQNGRIGIYTRDERQCIIARFHEKKRRRVWKKKIRYHCRKNLADRRVRVKGRFVRASSMDADAEADGGDADNAGMEAGGRGVDDGAQMDEEEDKEGAETDISDANRKISDWRGEGGANGSSSGSGSVGGNGTGSPGFVGKRSRLTCAQTGTPSGSAAEGMMAFWQSVASAGDARQQPGLVTDHRGPATTLPAITTSTVAEEDDDHDDAGEEIEDGEFGTTRSRSSDQLKTTGKRIRRYTIAY